MLRKTIIALAAVAALGTAALAPTSASAWGWYDGWGFYDVWYGAPGYIYSAPAYAESIASCARRHRTFDPVSRTFLANDGQRHYCW